MAPFDDQLARSQEERGRRVPAQRRPRRLWPAWCTLALAFAVLVAGMALPHGLVIAAGLVLAGIAGRMFEPEG
ncbi:DUF3040 domain-containing protein [Streptomyces sp. B22F1]|uniref:DUF3040 domain-containing protein n=1 Tax=Streptomyces sp. B22F1 TaxID=3153566 RepID=UPI00325C5E02